MAGPQPVFPKAAPAATPKLTSRESVNFDEIDALLEDASLSAKPPPPRAAPAPASPSVRFPLLPSIYLSLLHPHDGVVIPHIFGKKPAGAMRQSNASISMDELDALLDDQLAGSAKSSRRDLVSQQMSMDDIDALLGAAGPGAPSPQGLSKAPAKPKPAGIKPGVRPSQQMDMAEIADLLDKQKNSELNRTYEGPYILSLSVALTSNQFAP